MSAPAGRPDVLLDLPRSRHLSVGMRTYAEELANRLARVAPDLRFEVAARSYTLTPREQLVLPLELRSRGARLVHFLSLYAPFFAPAPFVVTVHDLIHLHFPREFKRSVGPYYATVVRGVCARAKRVIVDDERTVADLESFLGVDPAKVRVIPLGVASLFGEPAARRPSERPYFFYAGNHRAHKDLGTLLAAWEALPAEIEADLLLTGEDDLPDGMRRPERSRGRLRFVGTLDQADLRDHYAGALALVYPSRYEGFGLPLLEAAAAGARIVAAEHAVPSGLRPFSDRFAPGDVRAAAACMAAAARLPGRSEQAQRYARTQTWDRCAEKTAEVYREILTGMRV